MILFFIRIIRIRLTQRRIWNLPARRQGREFRLPRCKAGIFSPRYASAERGIC